MIVLKVSKTTAYCLFPPIGKLQYVGKPEEDRFKLGFNFLKVPK